MKKFLKFIGVIFAILIVYAVIALLFFDSHYHGEKSLIINAPAEKVWQNVNSMKAINSWSPWMKIDSKMKKEYTGNSGKIGDKFCWDGNDDAGSGCQEISNLGFYGNTTGFVSTNINFEKPFKDRSFSNIKIEKHGNDATKVTWDMNFTFSSMMKPMIPVFNWKMMKTFEEGLNDLKTLSEK